MLYTWPLVNRNYSLHPDVLEHKCPSLIKQYFLCNKAINQNLQFKQIR
jgi:hypothetical protein